MGLWLSSNSDKFNDYGLSSFPPDVGTFAVHGLIFLPLNLSSHEPHLPSSHP